MRGKVSPKSKRRIYKKWLRLFSMGLVTYIIGLSILIITGNTTIFPSVVILGNFLIPVAYVSFFYERRRLSSVNMSNTALSFFYGGFLGTLAAAILEPIVINNFCCKDALFIGLIEEGAKILVILLILKKKDYDLALDGIILGAAAGMGFAALESTGYAFNTFLQSGGSLSLTVYITLIRGILSPLGHGTWTAILAGVIARERSERGLRVNLQVISSYAMVVLLHAFWDGLPSIISIFTDSFPALLIGEGIIGIVGIAILVELWRGALRQADRKFTMDFIS